MQIKTLMDASAIPKDTSPEACARGRYPGYINRPIRLAIGERFYNEGFQGQDIQP